MRDEVEAREGRQAERRGRVRERRCKGCCDGQRRIERPKHHTTTVGESVHDAETGSDESSAIIHRRQSG